MSLDLSSLRGRSLLWFGLLGAPLAWAGQLAVGYGVTEAACGAAGTRWSIAPGTWALALTAAAGSVALAAGIAAATVWRATRGAGSEPPLGRIHFMATGSLLVAALFLVLILLGGLGAVHLSPCEQS